MSAEITVYGSHSIQFKFKMFCTLRRGVLLVMSESSTWTEAQVSYLFSACYLTLSYTMPCRSAILINNAPRFRLANPSEVGFPPGRYWKINELCHGKSILGLWHSLCFDGNFSFVKIRFFGAMSQISCNKNSRKSGGPSNSQWAFLLDSTASEISACARPSYHRMFD